MGASSRGFSKNGSLYLDRNSGHVAEDVGNRKTFFETKIPPDNVGNKIEPQYLASIIHDGLGNCVDEEPSHTKSGILYHLYESKERMPARRAKMVNQAYQPENRSTKHVSVPQIIQSTTQRTPKPPLADDYLVTLVEEFKKLLHERSGLPFSFSMRPLKDAPIDEQSEITALNTIQRLLEDILALAQVKAKVFWSRYSTTAHRFVVFFISPEERVPEKNKDLISALRKILTVYMAQQPMGSINVLLVLANAQGVIEGHLAKIGAGKLS